MKKLVFYFVIIAFINTAYGQQQQSQTQPVAPEPIDLPNFIIQGKMQLDVTSGVKMEPGKPMPLSSIMLDSLNSLEKQPALLIPIEPLPEYAIIRDRKNGFLSGNFGSYAIGKIKAGYGLNLDGYDLYGNAGVDFSGGHIENSQYTGFDVQLTSDYIAPQKFFIFGGSKTRTNVEFNNKNFKLYSIATPPDRNFNKFKVNIDVDGNYAGYQFETGTGFSGMQIKTQDIKTADNNYYGYIKVHNFWNDLFVAGNLLLDLHSLQGNSASFIQMDGSVSLINDDLSLLGNAGLQIASNPEGTDRGGLLISGSAEYRMNKLFTIRGNVRSGLENNNLSDIYNNNPYISNFVNLDYSYDIMNLKGFIDFHPSQDLVISAGFILRHSDRLPVYFDNHTFQPGSFDITYKTGTIIKSVFETYWNFTNIDKLNANLTAIQSSMSDIDNKNIPYTPEIQFGLNYERFWNEKLGTKFGIDYFGERFADIDNNIKLDAYLNLNIELSYLIAKDLKIFAGFDNMLNSDIIIWNGYKEKGLFASFSLMWQF
jgi:hypothetical protein